MTYTLDWRENALNSLAGYLDDDRAGVREVFTVLDELTANPYPPYATKIGSALRLRIGRYRIVYEIEDHTVTVLVIHVGRTN
ncbi:mRNA interferase RelE/StbE [Actinopolymorpha cephalotaxi]|uniref:mRNA interferase RelE/StbE n=1 Tax=Actinopolymorpha cephalotaxi TaxID=504797 RepID=A0A1I2URT9_9ACTN|nr:type II toxin-antitoxin system RelE/ParE family toxin [Actinopolymorpha cephalotaxi]NYH86707.1 mRNA interferase RelE/StbE [Actinopolymorpha cephalotaxi]SFG79758.1 mRNA interferase RelE/StbE [Actinopolymorpha cephalotaxi]